jgi:hypothetical protein
MRSFKSLLNSRKFQVALVALLAKAIFHYVPGFPLEIYQAIEELAITVIAGIAVEDAAQKFSGKSER